MRIDNYRGGADEALPSLDSNGAPVVPALPTFDSSTLLGVDMSHFQTSVDWAKLKAAGVGFVFIKATEGGTITDAKFAEYWAAAKVAGIPRGAYHFFRPKGPLQNQIDNFCKAVGTVEAGDLPPVLDVEVPEDWTGFTVAQRVAMVMGWLQAVEKRLGVRPIIYINNPMTRDTLGSPAAFKDYVLWVAHYTSASAPTVPAPWKSWTFWQYTEHGSIAGISGEVDLNRFAGTAADLQRLRRIAVAPQPASAPASGARAKSTGFWARLGRRIGSIFGCSCGH